MKREIVWLVLFTGLAAGLYAAVRRHEGSGQTKPGTRKSASGAQASLKKLRMYAHKATDHYDDNDHCVSYDEPGQRKPLVVEVDLSSDPGTDPDMDLNVFYTHPAVGIRGEDLSTTCVRQGPSFTTCIATFDEHAKSKVKGNHHPYWHLGDQPDGNYVTMGSLGPSVSVMSTAGMPGVFVYPFRNPQSCR